MSSSPDNIDDIDDNADDISDALDVSLFVYIRFARDDVCLVLVVFVVKVIDLNNSDGGSCIGR